MAIQLSGTDPVNTTFVSDGTRAQLRTQCVTALTTAGWVLISGNIYESATTPQGLKIRIDIADPGSGNCIQFKIRDNAALVGNVTFFLLPVNGATFRLWANKYQFFFFLSGTDMTKQRALVCAGVPWIPDFLKASVTFPYAGWSHGNGTSDTSATTLTSSFRKTWLLSAVANASSMWNNAVFGGAGSFNVLGMITQTSLTNQDDLWEDGTFTAFEPIICWSGSAFSTPTRHGQLWDAMLTSKPLDSETQRLIANLPWINITHQNGPVGQGRGCILLLTPN